MPASATLEGHSPAWLGRRRPQVGPLAEALGRQYEMLTPEHYGCDSGGSWSGEHAFTVADEAARTITLIDQSDEKVRRSFVWRRCFTPCGLGSARTGRKRSALRAAGVPPAALFG
jgi:hypothetical protein